MPTIQYVTALSVHDLNLLIIYSLYYRLCKNIVCVTSCYELEMLDEHTVSGSLFESISLQQNLVTLNLKQKQLHMVSHKAPFWDHCYLFYMSMIFPEPRIYYFLFYLPMILLC